jgi:type IV secretory pathway VirB4 component
LRLIADQGWSVWVHGICFEQTHYLPRQTFPDPTTALIEEEARRRYTTAGAHFESASALTIAWKPQHEWTDQFSRVFYEGETEAEGATLSCGTLSKTDEVADDSAGGRRAHPWTQRAIYLSARA